MEKAKKIISILILSIFLAQQIVYASTLRNPLGLGGRGSELCQKLDVVVSDNSLVLQKGLRLVKSNIVAIKILADVNFLDKPFSRRTYRMVCNGNITGTKLNDTKAHNHINRLYRDGYLVKVGYGFYKLSDDAKEITSLFSKNNLDIDLLVGNRKVKPLKSLNVLKTCALKGSGSFSILDIVESYKEITENDIDKLTVFRSIQEAKKLGYVAEVFYMERTGEAKSAGAWPHRYCLTKKGRLLSGLDLPIKGIFITSRIKQRFSEFKMMTQTHKKIKDLFIKKSARNKDYDWLLFCKWLRKNWYCKERPVIFSDIIDQMDTKLSILRGGLVANQNKIDVFKKESALLNINNIDTLSEEELVGRLIKELDYTNTKPGGKIKNIYTLRTLFAYSYNDYMDQYLDDIKQHIFQATDDKAVWHAELLENAIEAKALFGKKAAAIYWLRKAEWEPLKAIELSGFEKSGFYEIIKRNNIWPLITVNQKRIEIDSLLKKLDEGLYMYGRTAKLMNLDLVTFRRKIKRLELQQEIKKRKIKKWKSLIDKSGGNSKKLSKLTNLNEGPLWRFLKGEKDIKDYFEGKENELIKNTLAETRGNIKKAEQKLGYSESSFLRKRKRLTDI
ncbi:MAG: helix-turn-helix domain-containing protein [Candidatus Gorgyraea atricola]|nr:helix-turn-helix domain-containing protein [Candidatus Gorgyraea atricola]